MQYIVSHLKLSCFISDFPKLCYIRSSKMSKMSKIEKRPFPDEEKEGPNQILASVPDDESSPCPKKKVRLSRKLEVEESENESQRVDQSSKGVDVNENICHKENKDSVKKILTRTPLFTFSERKPRPSYPWTAEQTEVLKSAVESKSFQFLPKTTTDKIYKDMKKLFKRGNFERKDVFLWFLRHKETAQVSIYIRTRAKLYN